ncbi:MAG: hypothetical protein ACYCX4_02030 [Bacillota bacterium]
MFYVYAFAGMVLQLFLLYMLLFVIGDRGAKHQQATAGEEQRH